MLDWLLDDFWIIAFLLAVALVAFATAWWRTRKKQYAIGAGVFALLLGIYIVLPYFIETSSKQMERRVHEIAESVGKDQIKPVLEKHLANDFRVESYDKQQFIAKADALKKQYHVDRLKVWNEKLVEIDRAKRSAIFSFLVQPVVGQEQIPVYLVKAEFVMTPKESWWQREEWKLKSFKYFNGFVETESPLQIP